MLRGYVRLRAFHIMTDMSLPSIVSYGLVETFSSLFVCWFWLPPLFLSFSHFFYESFLGGFNLFICQLTVINLIKNPFTWRYDDSVCRI